ncbi:22270_t:CDS:2, partial [Racocetra persica]
SGSGGEKMVIEVLGDDNIRKEIISYLRSGKINYNYQIELNFFTSERNKHNEIIDGDDVSYGSLKGRVVLKGTDNEAIEKIKGHPEELAAAIFSKSH